MSSFLKFSTQLKNALLQGGDDFKALLDGGYLRIFDGPVPATADAAATGATQRMLITESDDGTTGLTFGTASGGVLPKTPSEVWSGTASSDGTATFWRFTKTSDAGTGTSGAGDYRVQGTIGTTMDASLIVPSTTLVNGVTNFLLNTFNMQYEDPA